MIVVGTLSSGVVLGLIPLLHIGFLSLREFATVVGSLGAQGVVGRYIHGYSGRAALLLAEVMVYE